MAELDGDPPAELQIDTGRDAQGDPIITLSGELDIAGAGSLEESLAPVMAQSPARLIFELKDLRFMDSAGIAVLVGAAKKVGAVKLRNTSPIVQRVVELTGLSDVLSIE
jgi:anti-sigma B factor antagonist